MIRLVVIGLEDVTDPGYPDFDPALDNTGMEGFMGVFWFFFVIVLVLAVGGFIWRVSAARDMARRSGMDVDEATAMAVMTENGLESTYLASNLRGQVGTPPTAPPRPAADRLAELASLRDSGAITEDEYATRRQTIIDSV